MKAKLFVVLQFLFIFFMLIVFYLSSYSVNNIIFYFSMILLFIGLGVGLLAIMANKIGNFNIRPTIKDNCKLITYGIYSYIRHPMYLSLLLIMFCILLLSFSILQIILYSLLFITLVYKLLYEESLWITQFNKYKQYMKTTKRLVPYVY